MPRGRPKGSKNKSTIVKVNQYARYVVGSGSKQFSFPIVREGSVSRDVATVVVNAESFSEALQSALAWALRYSEKESDSSKDNDVYFWPLVTYRTLIGNEKRYIKRVDKDYPYAWAESKDYGAWLPLAVLESR